MVDAPIGDIAPGTVVAGKLRVVRLIGEGGMGAVYEVEHEFTKHHRAMKLLHQEMTHVPGVVARFLREASAAGRIGSPHIVETFDAGTLETGEPYIVMELLDGRPLDVVIGKKGRLDFRDAVEIVRQACEGIQAAHAVGIIHRDLKPENLFLVSGERTFVKILDFGISKFDPSRTGNNKLTQEGSALGTPYYMSPEQVRGESDLDVRADVYALGVVLYECLTGKKPFYADTLPQIAVLIHEGKYEPPESLRPETPQELVELVNHAMNVDRTSRFPTARAFAEALDALNLSSIGAGYTLVAPATAVAGTPSGVVGDSTPPPEGHQGSGVIAAGTGPGATMDTAPQLKKGSKVWFAVAAVVVAAAIVATVFATRRQAPAPGANEAASVEHAAVASAPPGATATVKRAVEPSPPTPAVSPVVSVPEVVASHRPLPSAANAPARTVEHRPTAAPSAPRPTRADEHGLAEENPF